nr:flagellar type III secretion system protein FlhB [Tabrizicola sp. YIM 78059]
MNAEVSDSEEKEFEASPQRLEEARKKGDIPRSTDLLMAAGIAGFLLSLVALGGWVVRRSGTAGMVFLDQADRLSRLMFAGAGELYGGILLSFAGPPLALLLLPPVLVLLVAVATRAFVVTPSHLAPKLSRISLIAGARKKFGVEGLAEFGKSALKLILVAAILYHFLAGRIEKVLATLFLDPGSSMAFLRQLVIEFLFILLLVTVTLGGVDLLWQHHRHRRRNRMSRKEMMDEHKENEGDPHLKSARRQRAQAVATNRMLVDVATADVVVVNPTHFAVALRWDRKRGAAPVCVAKGVDEIALVIRSQAARHGVPVHSDPPAARAIYATVEIGQQIRPEHYRAVAAAIRFADAMRQKARRQ